LQFVQRSFHFRDVLGDFEDRFLMPSGAGIG